MAEQQAMASSQGVDPTSNSGREAGENEKNPAISNPHWEDAKGQAITKALVGDEVYLCADITDIAEGVTATIKIVEKDADGKDDPVTTLSAVVSDGKIKCQWQVTYTADEDDEDSQQSLKKKAIPCRNTPLWWSAVVPPVGRAVCWRCGEDGGLF